MAQTKDPVRRGKIAMGQRVKSKQVGCRAAFVGTIVGYIGSDYHVLDVGGAIWHRSASELTPVRRDA